MANLSSDFLQGPVGVITSHSNRSRGMSNASDDPLQNVMLPPRDETVAQKNDRIRSEALARKRSELIDKHLKEEMARTKKERANERTILLLGG